MSNGKKIIYRKEPIKKYKMHKVKKHWVVKGGVAGAMIVGSVGAPMVPHLAYAAETENVDPGDGEEVETKSLGEVQEDEFTTSDSTTVTETEELVTETSDSTNKLINEVDSESDESSENRNLEKIEVFSDNGVPTFDDVKYTIGSSDNNIQYNFKRLLEDDSVAPTTYSTAYFDVGFKLDLTFSEDDDLKNGDIIYLPLITSFEQYHNLFRTVDLCQ